MRLLIGLLFASVFAVLLTLTVHMSSAVARTREPTPTPAVTSTALPTTTPRPGQLAVFHGEEWADAQISKEVITAKIGDAICGTGGPIPIADMPPAYQVAVVSEEVKAGCGREGATITFLIGERLANQTGVWHAGTDTSLNLIAGPSFALLSGSTSLTCNERGGKSVIPFIDDVACGQEKLADGLLPPCAGQQVGYTSIVFSAQQRAGCGVEGSEIAFKVLDAQGKVVAVAKEKGIWHAWDGRSGPQQLNLTMVPVGGGGATIKIGNVGTGGSRSSNPPWLCAAAALTAAGLAATAAGVALRRRVIR